MRSGGEVSLFYALFPSLTTCTKVMYSGMLMISKDMPSTCPFVARRAKAPRGELSFGFGGSLCLALIEVEAVAKI